MAETTYVNAGDLTVATPASGQKIVGFNGTTEEGYQIDYDALADAILDKLTTKTYDDLSGRAVIPVLSALDTAFSETALASGTDLNNVTTRGVYYSSTSAVTTSLLNKPNISTSFVMRVYTRNGERPVQFIPYGNYMFIRTSTSSGFGEWVRFASEVSTEWTNLMTMYSALGSTKITYLGTTEANVAGAFTIANGSRIALFGLNNYYAGGGMFFSLLYATNAGAVSVCNYPGSSPSFTLDITAGTNSVSVTSNVKQYIYALVFAGDISVAATT